jgi:hypothetical protein
MTLSSRNGKKTWCVWLEDEADRCLSLSGAVMREEAMTVKAGSRTTVHKSMNIAFEVHVRDNTPGHLQDLCFDHPDIKVKHLSSTAVAAEQGIRFNNQDLSLCSLQYLEQECWTNVSEVFSFHTAECTDEGFDQLVVHRESGSDTCGDAPYDY